LEFAKGHTFREEAAVLFVKNQLFSSIMDCKQKFVAEKRNSGLDDRDHEEPASRLDVYPDAIFP